MFVIFFRFVENVIHEVINEAFLLSNINEIAKNHDLKSLQLWIWLTKGFLLRNSILFEKFMNKLFEWLDNDFLTDYVSQAFYIILNDYDHVMRRDKTNAIIKLFYKQRFFTFVIVKLKEKFNSIDNQSMLVYFPILSI